MRHSKEKSSSSLFKKRVAVNVHPAVFFRGFTVVDGPVDPNGHRVLQDELEIVPKIGAVPHRRRHQVREFVQRHKRQRVDVNEL